MASQYTHIHTHRIALVALENGNCIGESKEMAKQLPINRRNADDMNLSFNRVVDVQTTEIYPSQFKIPVNFILSVQS